MNELTISLDAKASRPLYEQIYEYIKQEIQNGNLPCRERLPSTRRLAQYLEVSRSTVTLAYEQLLSEGYIDNQPGSGYFVNDLEGLYRLPGEESFSGQPEREMQESWRYDFSPSGVDLGSFPHNTWRKISRELLMQENQSFFQLGAPAGEEELRRTIAAYVRQARGVRCQPQQIIIGAGNDYLLMLLNAILGKHTYALENPTYKKAYDIFRTLGQEAVAVETDESGMRVEALAASGAQVAYVMPSHQYPLGIVMPIGRRQQLLNWAAERDGRYVIEDDYDSEFRYKGKPIPALQGLDENGKVIYIGTFSKSIAPAIRISFLVLPQGLLERYRTRGSRFSSTVSRMDQKILAEFIRSGAYERHLNRMRSIYKGRHDALLEALKEFPEIFRVSGEYAGTHLLVTLPECISEERAVEAAKQQGVRVCGVRACCIGDYKPKETMLILGYANMHEEEICQAVRLLGKLYVKLASS
ncbi:transcriptional regulator, GntR family [Marvinbryantia formatexigens DSM 14469]|uniref:Transcriptional regulator, GntR family n=1 Tax=Marvinbryantia formatexigens DSM 14469 TaxID=478749 RepID=C6LA94_9FIRM|nr:aminotransferase class I/II-fold pyridoxal phosphate-dependent enzyme [Marvinbryantia formatexigens]EET62501.1 transcriptional regulator, GntR family [Marvinbryantia formatexigens DSM 14469]UWO24972.1 PLP-dependent aminotransferase family protein [Marvinbryantia formatexigens DSM 14469]SDG25869.1 GntR family transcriptional regulator / MocR family aminotransferase [Marvinbryantia formatexigens]